jgi:hypothetical protein
MPRMPGVLDLVSTGVTSDVDDREYRSSARQKTMDMIE